MVDAKKEKSIWYEEQTMSADGHILSKKSLSVKGDNIKCVESVFNRMWKRQNT